MKRCFALVCLFALISCSTSIRRANNTPNNKERQFRVITYNIHHANPPARKGIIDLDAIAMVLAAHEPDFIALQEVDVNTRRSGGVNEAEVLAQKLKMHVYFAKAIDYDGGDYGVAILSKYPMENEKTYNLPQILGIKTEPRVLATAKIILPDGKKITLASTHLDSEKDEATRKLQIAEIRRIVEQADEPVVLGGDLNTIPESQVIRRLDEFMLRSCTASCGFTFPVVTPNRIIDYIAVTKNKGFMISSHTVVQQHTASDHLPVLAVFNY